MSKSNLISPNNPSNNEKLTDNSLQKALHKDSEFKSENIHEKTPSIGNPGKWLSDLCQEQGDAMLQKMIQYALEGDIRTAKFLLSRSFRPEQINPVLQKMIQWALEGNINVAKFLLKRGVPPEQMEAIWEKMFQQALGEDINALKFVSEKCGLVKSHKGSKEKQMKQTLKDKENFETRKE